jgi:hypothetical protein
MKNLSKLLLILLVVNVAFAQSKGQRSVEESVTRLTNAMVTYDTQTLKKMTSPLLTYGHSNGLIEDQAEFIQNVTKGNTVFTEITLSEQWVRISGKTATVRHILDAKTSTNGLINTIKLKVLLVWGKQKGKWILLARQAVK